MLRWLLVLNNLECGVVVRCGGVCVRRNRAASAVALQLWRDKRAAALLRYVEANPVRAEIVQDAADWPWSSYAVRRGRSAGFELTPGPVALPPDWTRRVHRDIEARAMEALHNSLSRNRPLGDTEWIVETAKKMGLESTLRKRGRPKKMPDAL